MFVVVVVVVVRPNYLTFAQSSLEICNPSPDWKRPRASKTRCTCFTVIESDLKPNLEHLTPLKKVILSIPVVLDCGHGNAQEELVHCLLWREKNDRKHFIVEILSTQLSDVAFIAFWFPTWYIVHFTFTFMDLYSIFSAFQYPLKRLMKITLKRGKRWTPSATNMR